MFIYFVNGKLFELIVVRIQLSSEVSDEYEHFAELYTQIFFFIFYDENYLKMLRCT